MVATLRVPALIGRMCSGVAAVVLLAVIARPASAADALVARPPGWVALWHAAFRDLADPAGFDPERQTAIAVVDRTTGDAYLSFWGIGVWRSRDGGITFARADGGVISKPGCGPITGAAAVADPQGHGLAFFDMNNQPGLSGWSPDGGETWTPFTSVERNWDFGAMDFTTKVVIAARHEDDGLHVSRDGGQTWTRLARPRSGVSGLGVRGEVLLVGRDGACERSEDGGATWSTVCASTCVGQAMSIGERTWWLASERNGLIVSADAGRTWKPCGEPLPAPARQVVFGRDADHLVALTAAGIYESTDAAQHWSLVIALPPDVDVWNAAYDPMHDVFYATTREHQVFRFARGVPAAYVAPPIPRTGAGDAGPTLRFLDDVHARVRVWATRDLVVAGDFLYQCGEDGLTWFRRDLRSGGLTLVDRLIEERSGGYQIRIAGGRLYGVTRHEGYHRAKWHGLATFDLDPATGTAKRRGAVACPGADQLIAVGDVDLYVKTFGDGGCSVVWFRVDAGSDPVRRAVVSGAGIGAESIHDACGVLRPSPDGRHLYSISSHDYAIARIDRDADGAIRYAGATDLAVVAPRDAADDPHRSVSLAISPDGAWVFVGIRNGAPPTNRIAVFRRDAATGELAIAEAHDGEHDAVANLASWDAAFTPSGTGAYIGNVGPLVAVRYDAMTGRLSEPRLAAETLWKNTANLAYDSKHGLLYVASQEWSLERFCAFAADAAAVAR